MPIYPPVGGGAVATVTQNLPMVSVHRSSDGGPISTANVASDFVLELSSMTLLTHTASDSAVSDSGFWPMAIVPSALPSNGLVQATLYVMLNGGDNPNLTLCEVTVECVAYNSDGTFAMPAVGPATFDLTWPPTPETLVATFDFSSAPAHAAFMLKVSWAIEEVGASGECWGMISGVVEIAPGSA